ncbi:MAG: hypothetical protein COW92_04560 [Candidatus Omnitrophica bacterium CG22_combo_CG10-13_8_21_14_all_43_16]|nr:MAG: hypothetical protein COW92_04560 [Candidatus Omnitrophica bacterium CG22_combo_CG10-13_8_21_14_all_43_16]
MSKNYKVLEVSSLVFKVLSWASLAIGIVAGIVIFVGGGTPEAPRATGFVGILLGVVYFYMFLVAAEVIALLLEIRSKVEKGA